MFMKSFVNTLARSIKVSTWVNAQMKLFIEEEKMIEEMRKKRS